MARTSAKKNKTSPSFAPAYTGVTALYERVSTEKQAEEGYSIEAQDQKLKKWCELKDYTTYEVYPDPGWSGSNLDRPAMKQLISDITAGKIQRVVVYKLDRLSRSQKDTLYLLEELFLPYNVEFVSLNENFDTSSPYGKAMIGILSVFAQLERENIRERTRMGMHERVKSGYWMGGSAIPFGYDYDKTQDILIPNEHANDVRAIYDLYLKGYSTTQLAKMFPVCSDRHITQILDRVTYLGKINYNGEIFDGLHQPLIDENTWHRVQVERSRRSTKNIVTSDYLLTGLMYCGKCGAKMRYQKWGKDKVKVYCYSQQKSKPNLVKDPNCNNMRCNAADIERVVLEDLFTRTDGFNSENIKPLSNKSEQTASGLQMIQQRYDMLTAKIKRLYNLYAESEDEILLSTIKENQAELASVSRILEAEKATQNALDDIIQTRAKLSNLRTLWPSMSMAERHNVLRNAIKEIRITDNLVDVAYLF